MVRDVLNLESWLTPQPLQNEKSQASEEIFSKEKQKAKELLKVQNVKKYEQIKEVRCTETLDALRIKKKKAQWCKIL